VRLHGTNRECSMVAVRLSQSGSEFDAAITGWRIVEVAGDGVKPRRDSGGTLAFGRDPGHGAPRWPTPDRAQQARPISMPAMSARSRVRG
jgi:hypothetical protein